MLLQQIGEFEFLDLVGFPEQVKRQISAIPRAGVDGHTIIDEGSRGKPFTLTSRVDQQDLAQARATYAEYCTLIGDDPVELVWQNIDLSVENFLVVVLDVVPRAMHALAWGSAGGLHPPSLAWLECDWQLLALATEP
jgi:hypothetical protein